MRSIYPSILEQIRHGGRCILATVVRTSGSTPQKPGSAALFAEGKLLAGTIGGGLLEGEVQHLSEKTPNSDLYSFDLDSKQGKEGAICGGEVDVLVDASPAMQLKAMDAMAESLTQRKQGFFLTLVGRKKEADRSITTYWMDEDAENEIDPELEATVAEAVRSHIKQAVRYGFTEVVLRTDTGSSIEKAYLEHLKPMPHLVIAGGGHVGRALAHLGTLLEFEVTVVDDRQEFANRSNIPDADHLVVKEVGTALLDLEKVPDTYIVIVTRGHQHDAEALKSCIGSHVAYIGMIGSAHKVAVMREQFLDNQWATPDQWSEIYTPIGIDIGSRTVEEIAISIAAQLVEVRSRKTTSHAE